MHNTWLLMIVGLVAGILSGLLGIGGAIVVIPALVLMGYPQYEAQGTTLLMLVLPVSSLAAWQYYREGFVDIRAAIILAALFFAGSYLGARAVHHVPADVLKKIFAVMLILVGLKVLFFDRPTAM